MSNQFETKLQAFRDNFEDLIHAIERKRIVFFVGSGISRASPTNIETAKELSRRLQENFGSYSWWRNYFDLSNLTSEQRRQRLYDGEEGLPRLEEIAELFFQRGMFRQFIDTIVGEGTWQTVSPNICHTIISELLIEEFCSGVITTNQDNRIEIKHQEYTPRGNPPHIISHDDFYSNVRATNNIFKVHGCLFYSQEKKYQSTWATSQLTQEAWPDGVCFSHEVITSHVRSGYKIVFVAFSTYLRYLEKTISQAIEAGGNHNQIYCVNRQCFDEMSTQPDTRAFLNSIQLERQRYCQMDVKLFFRIVRHIVFENLLNELCRNNVYLKGEEFNGGTIGCWRISIHDFQDIKTLLKQGILKTDREVFQKYLQLILLEEDSDPCKYVSFKYRGDRIAKLLFILALLRFNYELIFCRTRYRHLFIRKNSLEVSLVILDGDGRKPLQSILEKLNRKMEKDYEMLRHIKNVLVYDASDYRLAPNIAVDSVGTGRITEIEQPASRITNTSKHNYCLLHEDDLRIFLSDSTTLDEFKQKLGSFPWRT